MTGCLRRGRQSVPKPKVTRKRGIRFVVVRVVEDVFFRKQIRDHP